MKSNSQYRVSDGLRFQNSFFQITQLLIGVMLILGAGGCGTTTTRIGTEQLLISDAVDQAISQIDFRPLRGEKVFLDTQYMKSFKGTGIIDSGYIISSIRNQLTAAQCLVQEKPETADIVIEPRVGALGTDGQEVVYGVPQSGSISSAAAILSNSPIPVIPEISVGKSNAQSGIAKVIVFAYDRENRTPVWQSGIAKAESTSSNTWIFGAGPFQKGTIHEELRFAGHKLPPTPKIEHLGSERWRLDGIRIQRSDGDSAEFVDSEEPVTGSIGYGEEHVFSKLFAPRNSIPPATPPDESAAELEDATNNGDVQQATHKEKLEDE